MKRDARAIIGLGANLGDSKRALADAVDAIDALPTSRVVLRSSLYQSSPVAAAGPDYLNQVVAIDTGLTPLALLRALLAIEARAGRERPARNAPRLLDLDLLLLEDADGLPRIGVWPGPPSLVLPHPRLSERRFVVEPLAEILPEFRLPGIGPIGALLSQLRLQGDQRCERLPNPG